MAESKIRCSVGITAYNEEANIGRLLQAVLDQRLSRTPALPFSSRIGRWKLGNGLKDRRVLPLTDSQLPKGSGRRRSTEYGGQGPRATSRHRAPVPPIPWLRPGLLP
jgi:hypothetical protein